jgi:hypothetical protein
MIMIDTFEMKKPRIDICTKRGLDVITLGFEPRTL